MRRVRIRDFRGLIFERKRMWYAGGGGLPHHETRPPDDAAREAPAPLFFSASASHELTGICVHLRLIGIGKSSGQSRACRDGQRAPEDPGGIGAEREDRGSTPPPDGARSGQGSPPAPLLFSLHQPHDQRLNQDGQQALSAHGRRLDRIGYEHLTQYPTTL